MFALAWSKRAELPLLCREISHNVLLLLQNDSFDVVVDVDVLILCTRNPHTAPHRTHTNYICEDCSALMGILLRCSVSGNVFPFSSNIFILRIPKQFPQSEPCSSPAEPRQPPPTAPYTILHKTTHHMNYTKPISSPGEFRYQNAFGAGQTFLPGRPPAAGFRASFRRTWWQN